MYDVVLSLTLALNGLLIAHWSMGVFRLRTLTIGRVFYWGYLAIIYVPSVVLFLNSPGPKAGTFLAATTSVLLLVPLGASASRLLTGSNPRGEAGLQSPIGVSRDYETGWKAVVFVAVAASALFVLVFIAVSPVNQAIFVALKNPGSPIIAAAREDSFKLLPVNLGTKYLLNWTRTLILPTLAVFAYLMWRTRGTQFWFWIFCSSLAIAVIYAALAFAKGPVAWIFAMLFLSHVMMSRSRIKVKTILVGAALVFLFPFIVQWTRIDWTKHPESGVVGRSAIIGQSLGKRIFYVPIDVLYKYFEVTDDIGFLHGRSVGASVLLTGEPGFPLANYVGRKFYPRDNFTVNANAAFVGNLYVDFGLPGVFIGAFFVGAIVQIIDNHFRRQVKTPLKVTIYVYLVKAFFLLTSIPLPIVLMTGGVITIFVFWWGMKSIAIVFESVLFSKRLATN